MEGWTWPCLVHLCAEGGLPAHSWGDRELANPPAARVDLRFPLDKLGCNAAAWGGQHAIPWALSRSVSVKAHVGLVVSYVLSLSQQPVWTLGLFWLNHLLPPVKLRSLWLSSSMVGVDSVRSLWESHLSCLFLLACVSRWPSLPLSCRVEQRHSWTG